MLITMTHKKIALLPAGNRAIKNRVHQQDYPNTRFQYNSQSSMRLV